MTLRQVQGALSVATRGRGFTDLTAELGAWLRAQGAEEGVLTLLLQHTSAGLTIQENADPDVLLDLGAALARLAPEGDHYVHDAEGPDDMPAHIRSLLTGVTLSLPVAGGRMRLGTWQGVYLAEHRSRPHQRRVALAFFGV